MGLLAARAFTPWPGLGLPVPPAACPEQSPGLGVPGFSFCFHLCFYQCHMSSVGKSLVWFQKSWFWDVPGLCRGDRAVGSGAGRAGPSLQAA